jgi:hypothetical protein
MQGGFYVEDCPLSRDWVCRDFLDTFRKRSFFGNGPVAARDIHDVSAL